ncbi:MAG: hypothetical protein ACOC7P_03930, partial [Chloroflexota bacterium]
MSKARSRSNQGRKVKESQPARKRFFSFIASPVLRRLILIVLIVVLLYVFWKAILTLFGYGLVIIAIALGSLVWVAWRRQFSVVKHRWNWILGGISLACAVWGILAFFSPESGPLSEATLGGRIGLSIILHSPNIVGGLFIAGLVLLGIIFIIPRKSWSAAKNSWHFLSRLFRRRPRVIFPKQTPAKNIPLEATSPEVGAVSEVEEKPAVLPSPPVWQSEHEPILTPGGWHLPPIDILDKPAEVTLDRADIDQRARLIEE